MTTLEQSLEAFLTTGTRTAPLVANRVYPLRVPQAVTLPALSYRRVSGLREYSHAGASGLSRPRMEVTCWAETYGGAKALATAVRQDLETGYRDFADSLMLQNEIDLLEEETQARQVVLDFLIGHRED